MRRLNTFLSRGLLTIALGFGFSAAAIGQDYTLAQIRAAWESRQAAVQTFDCQWHENWIVEKGYWSSPLFQEDASADSSTPPYDVEFQARVRLRVKANKYRREIDEQIWSDKKHMLVPRSSIATSDGINTCIYYLKSDMEHPDAIIDPVTSDGKGLGLQFATLMFLYRPLVSRRGNFVLEQYRVVGQPLEVNGDPLITIEKRQNRSTNDVGFKSFRLSPQKGFAVIGLTTGRLQGSKPPRIGTQLNVAITTTMNGIPRPNSWSYRQSAGHGPGVVVQATVDYCRLNEPLDDGLFSQNEFAVGTWVTDQSGKEAARWLVRENGEKRPILRADFGAPYEDIKNTEPGQATLAGASWYRGSRFVILNILILIVLIVLLWLWTRRKSQLSV
jgi:hypothetical protein